MSSFHAENLHGTAENCYMTSAN